MVYNFTISKNYKNLMIALLKKIIVDMFLCWKLDSKLTPIDSEGKSFQTKFRG